MAQHDYNIANADGATFRADINSVLQAILTNNSGSTAPSTTIAGMFWGDTSNASTYYLKMRNDDNNGWITLFVYDVAGNTISPPNTPAGNISATTVQAAINELDTEKVAKITSTANKLVKFSDTSSTITNSVIYDDGTNVGIGTSSPSKLLDVAKGSIGAYAIFSGDDASKARGLVFSSSTTTSVGDTHTLNAQSTTGVFAISTNSVERMRIDSSGNVGIGDTPYSGVSAARYKLQASNIAFQVGTYGALQSLDANANQISITYNTYFGKAGDGSGSYAIRYSSSSKTASQCYYTTGTGWKWDMAPSGTAGDTITFATAMTLDASGVLSVTANNTINTGSNAAVLGTSTASCHVFRTVTASGFSTSETGYFVGKNINTNRSINAAGTINASGADYAEYERNNGIAFPKGSIVGFKADGTLTDKYSESIRFAIKSTNPSYVGGDTWGTEDIVGKRPEQPTRKLDTTEQKLVSEAIAEVKDEDGNITTEAKDAIYETVIIEAGDTDTEWEAIEAKYKADLADFEARLEAERQKVDRIAYSGKVPVNVTGAVAGQYVCVVDNNDSIGYELVNKADMTFAQYQDAVGRVNRILEDGRAEVAVVIH